GGGGREERGGIEVPTADEGEEEDRAEGVRLLRQERTRAVAEAALAGGRGGGGLRGKGQRWPVGGGCG
ncbi:hypothetical protein GW17_00051318, partial [Ensete ventricosum]